MSNHKSLRFLSVVLASCVTVEFGLAKEPEIPNSQNVSKPQYLALIAQKCSKFYFPLPEWDQSKAVARFDVSRNGTISKIQILQHPTEWRHHQRVELADKCIIEAVRNLKPLPPPPLSVHCPATVALVFDAKSHQGIRAEFSDGRALIDTPLRVP